MKKLTLALGLFILGSCSIDTLQKDDMSTEVAKEYKNEKFDDTLLVIKEKHGTNTKVYLFDKKGENFKGSFDTENEEVGTGIFFGIFLSFLLGGIIYAIVND